MSGTILNIQAVKLGTFSGRFPAAFAPLLHPTPLSARQPRQRADPHLVKLDLQPPEFATCPRFAFDPQTLPKTEYYAPTKLMIFNNRLKYWVING
ncbi:hypothetical protein GWI33_008025 [Rhynchophorus ferrugineus]|nr:hypothetical protein GWI33_008025 [Rhynchophorus ferrugineus]